MQIIPAPPRLQPAFYGGLFIGVLSALPVISIGNCCCLWVLGGGMLAVYLMQQNHPYQVTAADGALVGLLAGVFGGIIGTIISIPMDAMMGPYMQRMMQRIIESNPDFPAETRTIIDPFVLVHAPAYAPTTSTVLLLRMRSRSFAANRMALS